jgi:probable HAF family extracellular repeat protein
MYDLNNLIAPSSGLTLEYANAINDKGQIAGWGYNSSGQVEAFLLTPTPEPSTLALLAAGALGLAAYAWRRRWSPRDANPEG